MDFCRAGFARMRKLAWLLDAQFGLPGTRFRFGVNSLLGLSPVVGDVALGMVSLYLIYEAKRLGAPDAYCSGRCWPTSPSRWPAGRCRSSATCSTWRSRPTCAISTCWRVGCAADAERVGSIRNCSRLPAVIGGGMASGVLVGKGAQPQVLELGFANRHGLITGATGTGKTVTLQVLAEGFSRAGVPVFCADVKGDLSGIAARPASANPQARARARSSASTRLHLSRVPGRSSGTCSASRATRSAPPSPRWARCCWRGCWSSTTRRRACSTSPSRSPTSRACCCSTSRTCRRCWPIVAEHAGELTHQLRQRHQGHRRHHPARACWCSSSRAPSTSSASRRSTSRT